MTRVGCGGWFGTDHYDGGYLFRDKINLEASWKKQKGWQLRYGFDSAAPNQTYEDASYKQMPDHCNSFTIPIEQETLPGIKATLRIETRPWN